MIIRTIYTHVGAVFNFSLNVRTYVLLLEHKAVVIDWYYLFFSFFRLIITFTFQLDS